MNTYDVDLAGYFATEAGHVYGEIRDKVIPYFQKEHANAKQLYAWEKDRLEKLKSFVERLDATNAAMKSMARECQGNIGNRSFQGVLSDGVSFAKAPIDVSQATSRFSVWADKMDESACELREAARLACVHCAEGVKCAEEFASVFATGIGLWELAQDVFMCDYVFEHADMKYKTKICRDIIKLMPQAVQKADAFLSLYEKGKYDLKQNTELLIKWANEVYEQGQNRLAAYRHVRSLIESDGIQAAFAQWQKAMAYSKNVAAKGMA